MNSHISITVPDPERAARIIADLWRGEAMAMPPHDGTWIAYADDGEDSAVEVYPTRTRPRPGASAADQRKRRNAPHIVLASPLGRAQIEAIARRENALPKTSERGPFVCVDMWIENWLRIEVVAFAMRVDHGRGASAGPTGSVHELPLAAARRRRR